MRMNHYRTGWISDVHLGTKGSNAGALINFLRDTEFETLYLVGDLIDIWALRRGIYWPQDHNDVIQKLLRKGRKGTEIIYIIGNHDEFLREYIAEHQFLMGNIAVLDEATHVTKTGDRLWIIHGDAFDGVTRHHRWVALLGDAGYTFLLWSNGWFNQLRRLLHLPYWSLSAAIKHKVKQAVNFVYDFEHTVAREAGKRGYDGVVCGHIHQAQKSLIDGINYYNCGDWVESCTALAEDEHGEIHILHWAQQPAVADNVIPLKIPLRA